MFIPKTQKRFNRIIINNPRYINDVKFYIIMKKTLFLIMVIALSFGAYAQESFSASSTDMTTDGIVRGDKTNQFFISYCKYAGQGCFLLTDGSNTYDYKFVDSSWDILDFQIVDNKVVFCGTVTETIPTIDPPGYVYNKYGLIGSFDINDLYGSSLISFYPIGDISVSRFNKVAAINKTSCLYAIGEYDYPIPIFENGVVIGYYTGHATCVYIVDGWTNYPNYTVTKYGITNVDLTDLSATDDYVVAVGDSVSNSVYSGLYLARFSGTPNIDVEYYYKMYDEPLSDYHSIGIDKNHVVVACLAGGPTVFSTNINVVDLNMMAMVNSQKMPLESKAEPTELAHFSVDNSVVMQQYMPLPSNPSVTKSLHVKIDPSQTTIYSTYGFYHSNYIHSSLGSMDGKYAIGFSGSHWLIKDISLPPSPICYVVESIRIAPFKRGCSEQVQWLFQVNGSSVLPPQILVPNQLPNISIDCQNQ